MTGAHSLGRGQDGAVQLAYMPYWQSKRGRLPYRDLSRQPTSLLMLKLPDEIHFVYAWPWFTNCNALDKGLYSSHRAEAALPLLRLYYEYIINPGALQVGIPMPMPLCVKGAVLSSLENECPSSRI